MWKLRHIMRSGGMVRRKQDRKIPEKALLLIKCAGLKTYLSSILFTMSKDFYYNGGQKQIYHRKELISELTLTNGI